MDIHIRIDGRAGRITLARPKALNALSYDMCLAMDAALRAWATDEAVALVLIDAQGDKAFCAGGDISDMYATGCAGDFDYGRRFWRDEYRMNARLAEYPKPVVSMMQGFVMGGGVGVGCHASHRIVCDSTQIAMPECAIGLIPDVGGSYLLARAPGRLGAYLGISGARMGPGDAIHAGFADGFVAQSDWASLSAALCASGDIGAISYAAPPAPTLPQDVIDHCFDADGLVEIADALRRQGGTFAQGALKSISRNAPLSMACTLAALRNLGKACTIRDALAQEFRFTWRAMEHSDFIEGIRAAIIDKDRKPKWRHESLSAVDEAEVAAMLASLGPDELTFEQEGTQ